MLRIKGFGTPPYNLLITNFSTSTLIWSYTNLNTDDIQIPENIESQIIGKLVKYQLTDSTGKVFEKVIDGVTLSLKKRYWKGIAITNGSPSNHIEAINKSAAYGLNYVGVIFNIGNGTDTEINALTNGGTYNHTVSGTYAQPFDETVRTAYLTNTTNLANRVVLKVQILITRDDNRLNNGTTITLAFASTDLSLRPDGTRTVIESDQFIANITVGSYASTAVQTYSDRLVTGFFKRYRAAIEDGTIAFIGVGNTRAAEGEYESTLVNNTGAITGFSNGDYNSAMVAGFKTQYPEFSATSNATIGSNDRTNTDLGKKWTSYLSNYLAKFESDRISAVLSAIPTLTRTQFWLRDVGSYMDSQAGYRRTWNAKVLMHPKTLCVKCNDGPTDNGTNNFILDELCSLAATVSAIAITEPTPPNHDFASEPNRTNTRNMIASMVLRGVGASFIDSRTEALQFFTQDTALSTAPSLPKFRNDFKVISGILRSFGHTYNLSAIVAENTTYGGWRNSYEAFKTTNGISTPFTLPIDDIGTSIPVGSTTTSTTSSTSTTTSNGGDGTTLYRGVREVRQNGILYRLTDGRNNTWEVLSNGNLKLNATLVKKSFDNSSDVSAVLVDDHFMDIDSTEKTDMLSTNGMVVQRGDRQQIDFYYLKTSFGTDAAACKAAIYTAFDNQATYRSNSGRCDTVMFEVI